MNTDLRNLPFENLITIEQVNTRICIEKIFQNTFSIFVDDFLLE